MKAYLQPQDDGRLLQQSGEWVAEKLDYLERYIAIFENSMLRQRSTATLHSELTT